MISKHSPSLNQDTTPNHFKFAQSAKDFIQDKQFDVENV